MRNLTLLGSVQILMSCKRNIEVLCRIVDMESPRPRRRELTKEYVESKSFFLIAVEREVDEKSKVLAYLEIMPTLSPDHMKELERYKQVMLDMHSSLNLDIWMDTD